MKRDDRFRSALIIGGAGFIGSNWAHWLLERSDARIHIYDNLSRRGVRHNLESLQKAAGHSGRLQITVGDVRDTAKLDRAVRFATEIYHFAAQVAVTTSVLDPRLDFDVNLAGTFNLLEAVRKSGHRPFLLFTSTNKVYGELSGHTLVTSATRHSFANEKGISEQEPLDFHSPYGCSKGAAEQYVHDYARLFHIPSVVVRMSCIAGPHQFGDEDQGWVAHFLYSALQNAPVVIYGDGRQVRDVLCVDDLMRGFESIRALLPRTSGQIYNVGGGERNSVSLLELMAMIEQLTGSRVDYVRRQRRAGDQSVYWTDHSKLTRDTAWKPEISVAGTLERIYGWWRRNRQLFPAPEREFARQLGTLQPRMAN